MTLDGIINLTINHRMGLLRSRRMARRMVPPRSDRMVHRTGRRSIIPSIRRSIRNIRSIRRIRSTRSIRRSRSIRSIPRMIRTIKNISTNGDLKRIVTARSAHLRRFSRIAKGVRSSLTSAGKKPQKSLLSSSLLSKLGAHRACC